MHPNKNTIHIAEELFGVCLQVSLIEVKFQLHSRTFLLVNTLFVSFDAAKVLLKTVKTCHKLIKKQKKVQKNALFCFLYADLLIRYGFITGFKWGHKPT